MTPFSLICYILCKALIALFLSLLLAFRQLLSRMFNRRASKQTGNVAALYEGTLRHVRRLPVHHRFKLAVRYALIDLDRPPYVPPHCLSADEARRAAKTNGPVYLLMIPPSVGYERNPIIFYYCYDHIEGSTSTKTLTKCIAEPYNTPASDSARFVFNPVSDTVPKSEHISPFMDMHGNWRLNLTEPGENICCVVSVQHPKLGNFFNASFKAKKVTSDDHDAFFWLMPHKVSIVTYWNALQLWWKKVPFYKHPKYKNPNYRTQAVVRDAEMQGCTAFGGINKEIIDRCFTWKDAE